MLKKLTIITIVLAFFLLMITGCAGTGKPVQDTVSPSSEEIATPPSTETEEGETSTEYTQEPITMKIGHSMATTSPRHLSLLLFEEWVEARTNGAVQVELYPSGQLGTEAEQVESVKMGTLEATRSGCYEDVCPKLLLYTMPYLFEDIEGVKKIMRGPLGEEIAEGSKDNGVIILATGDGGGLRQFTNNVRPITKPEDMVGLKMRTPPIDTIIKTMEAMGASPVQIPYVETYMALKTGVADGEENPYINIANMKFHEVQKYLTTVSYQFHPDPFYVNLNWFESLEPQTQEILKECAKEMMVASDTMVLAQTQESFDLIKDSLEITELTDEQRQAFIEAVQPVYDHYVNEGMFAQEEIDAMREAAK